MKQLKKTKRPVILTVKGKAAAVIQDAAALVDSGEGIRQGLADAKSGRTRPLREFLAEFEAKHGIAR